MNTKKNDMSLDPIFASDLGEIQTPNLLSRNQVHYSVMLRGLVCYSNLQIIKLFEKTLLSLYLAFCLEFLESQ